MYFHKCMHRGVATASIRLTNIEVNQCPQPFYIPNAFKDTAVCDFTTTYVIF